MQNEAPKTNPTWLDLVKHSEQAKRELGADADSIKLLKRTQELLEAQCAATEPTQAERVAQLQRQRDELYEALHTLVGLIEAGVHLPPRGAPALDQALRALKAAK